METFLMHALAVLIGIASGLAAAALSVFGIYLLGAASESKGLFQVGPALAILLAPVAGIAGLIGGYICAVRWLL